MPIRLFAIHRQDAYPENAVACAESLYEMNFY